MSITQRSAQASRLCHGYFNNPMSAELTADVVDSPPRRTWQQWWRQLPGYWRIAAWAALIVVGLQLAIALRVAVGLWEAAEIQAFRRPGVTINYRADFWSPRRISHPRLVSSFRILAQGLMGRSCRQVRSIVLRDMDVSAEDFRTVCRDFPRLESLNLLECRLDSDALSGLSGAPPFRSLSLIAMDIDDRDVEQLAKIETWEHLVFQNTLVGDESLPRLKALPRLFDAYLGDTLVTQEGIDRVRDQGRGNYPYLSTTDSAPSMIRGWIRWSDGRRNSHCSSEPFALVVRKEESEGVSSTMTMSGEKLERHTLQWLNHAAGNGDGEYIFTLKIGSHESLPVPLTIQNREPSTRRLEFQMPVPRPIR